MRFQPLAHPRGHVIHCAPLAASVALGVDYGACFAALGSPRPQDVVLVRDMVQYLQAHGLGTRHFDEVRLGTATWELMRGRFICFTKLVRDGVLYGHFAAVLDGVLHDLADTRDGVLRLAWSRRWPPAEIRP